MSAEEHGRYGRLPMLAVLGLATVFLFSVHQRILTYVCGNDPMYYIRAARVLLAPALYGHEAVIKALTFVAPGYPLILAGAIALFGQLSPYWVNLCFLLATLPLMWLVFRRLMGSDRAAAFSLLGLLLIAFRSHELNAPYLLYPFREAARVFFVYLAFACLVHGVRRDRAHGAWVLGASAALLAGCAIREPTALVLPGMVLGLGGLSPTWRLRLKTWGWFLLPWVVVAGIAAVVLTRFALRDISQFSVVRYLGGHDVAIARGKEMLGWFPARVGWFGVALMTLGAGRALWRARILCAWFLLPGILLFIFCAYMQMHARYFLSALLFLAVFAGYGLDGVCAALERIGGKSRFRSYVRSALTLGSIGLLAAGLFQTFRHVKVWGPEIKVAEVREWQSLVSRLEPAADGRVRVAVEQRTRYLEDLLLAYTDAELLDPKQIDAWPARWAPAHYFRPLNGRALYAAPQWLMWLKIFAHRILEDRLDLFPAASGSAAVRTIGAGRYEQYLLRPWAAGSQEQMFTLEPGRDQVVWLDWGATPESVVRTVSIRNAQTGAPWFSRVMEGNGLQAIRLPGSVVDGGQGALSVVSSSPAPARPLFSVVDASRPQEFTFDKDRRVSLNRLLVVTSDNLIEDVLVLLAVGQSRQFRAPALYSDASGGWSVCFRGTINPPQALRLRIRRRDGKESVHAVTADGEACSIEMEGGETVDVILESSQVPPQGQWLAIRVSFGYRPTHGKHE